MVGILAWAYVRYGSLPAVSGLLYGVKPVVIAIILQALWKLGRTAIKRYVAGHRRAGHAVSEPSSASALSWCSSSAAFWE